MMKLRQKTKTYDSDYRHLDKAKNSSDESEEEMELFVKARAKRKETPTIEKVIEDGDTLQSLAIRYACTIGDLKRLNNIEKENEIFAKRTIKVPHKPISMAIAGVHTSGRSSPDTEKLPSTENLIDIEVLNTKFQKSGLAVLSDPMSEVNQIIFNSQMNQKEYERVQEVHIEEICDEEVQLLPTSNRQLRQADPVVNTLRCSGADADISWIGLIVFIVVLIFAFPLFYVFYVAEHIETYRHHGS